MARRRAGRAREFFEIYTKDLTADELQRLFTRDARDAYRFFARGIDSAALAQLPLRKRWPARLRLFFLAFSLKLSPARRIIYGAALVAALLGVMELFRGIGFVDFHIIPFLLVIPLPMPVWHEGTFWLVLGFLLANLLVLLEVADRLSLKNDLEIAREIQQALLPRGTHTEPGVEAYGLTRPANTVGGDFYDILPLADGRLIVALGDVAGKGSPAALLMALLVAILRTLVDEELEPTELMQRLNTQVVRHAPGSRFVTLFLAVYDPVTGALSYVNAGHTPPLVRRADGLFDRLTEGGIALGMFELSRYTAAVTALNPGDLLIAYSDGITEAEDPKGRPFEESGLETVIASCADREPQVLGAAVIDAVAAHAQEDRFADDLTILVLRRVAVAAAVIA